MSLWLFEESGRADTGETLLNLPRLLLHLPVNEHCCWRYPCVPCHEASRQHLHLTLWPQRKMAAAVTDVFTVLGREPWETCTVRGPGCIAGNNCYNMCLPQCTCRSYWKQGVGSTSTSKMTGSPSVWLNDDNLTVQCIQHEFKEHVSVLQFYSWKCVSLCGLQGQKSSVSQDWWPG